MSGGARSDNVPRWRQAPYRPSMAASRAVQAAGEQLQALHEALGRTAPPCAGDDRWTTDERADVRHAQAGCQPCPAREECVAYGRAIGARTGVWGGQHLGPRWTRNTTTDTEELTA